MQQNNVAETLIGAVVVAVAVGFLAFAYSRTGSGGLSGYEINARLPKADGLAVGTDVRLAGIKIGTVTDLTLDPKTYLVTVHMSIRNDIKLPVDSSVLVTQAGFLGGQYLSITPGRRRQDDGRGLLFRECPGLDRRDGAGGPLHRRGRHQPPSRPQPKPSHKRPSRRRAAARPGQGARSGGRAREEILLALAPLGLAAAAVAQDASAQSRRSGTSRACRAAPPPAAGADAPPRPPRRRPRAAPS